MNRVRASSWLARRVDIRPGEGAAVFGLFAYFFVTMAAGYIILPLKIANFLKKLDLGILPLVLFGTAVAMSFVASVNSRFLQKLKPRRYIQSSLVFFMAGLALFWWLEGLDPHPRWSAIVFWFWAEMFLAVSVIQFWILVNDVFSPRRAKRFIGLFVVGGLLGGIAGSVLTRIVKDRPLYLLCVGFLFIAFLLLRTLPAVRADEPETAPPVRGKVGYLESFRTLVRNRYLVFLSGMMLAAFGASQIISFQFNSFLQAGVDADRRKAYLAAFNSILLIASTLFHVLFTGRLLKRFGLKVALYVSPILLAGGAAAGWLLPAASGAKGLLGWATVLRGADKSLSHSLSQSTREILYIPVPPETRAKAKVFIDLFVNKFADALAAFLLYLSFSVLGIEVRSLSGLTLAFILAWALLNRRLIQEYIGTIRKNLTVSRPDADQLILDHIDVDATKLVFDTLESRNRSSVLYAMNLLDLISKDKLTPELRSIIAAKSSEVRAGSLDALLDVSGEALLPDWGDALDEADLGAEIREVLSLDVYQTVMGDHIRRVAESHGEEASVAQMEVAKALGMMEAGAPLVGTLRSLLKSGSHEVVRYALESAGRQAKREFVPLILLHLGRPSTAEASAAALVECGGRIAGMLDDALRDPREDARVRKALPGVLARIGTQRTADLLLAGLDREDPEIRDETIEALFRLRTMRPVIVFDERAVRPAVLRQIRKACSTILAIEQAVREKSPSPLAADLEALLSRTVKRIFELLSLVHPREDIVRAYQNYREGSKKSVDFALELLENILRKDVQETLLPILEDHPVEEKARVARRVLKALEP
jgi:ATP:ADP antiporter, AAA family